MGASFSSFPAAGILGFVGGDAASSALITNHLLGRRWFPSAFNTPGSVALSQRLSSLSNSRSWDGQHGGVCANPGSLIASLPSYGPKFTATHSGTRIPISGEVSKILLDTLKDRPTDISAEGRVTIPTAVTVVDLHSAPAPEEHPVVATRWSILRLFPFAASIAGTAFCAFNDDLWSAAMIAAGILASSVASRALSAGDLTFTRPTTAPGAPRGDGYLESDNEVIVLRGEEGAVTAITRGKFALRFKSESSFRMLALSSSLFTAQCVAQLLFVPFGTPVGQITFLATLGVSWLYNLYVAAQEKEAWRRLVVDNVLKKPSIKRYALGTRATTAVFVMAMLKPADIEKQLLQFLPNETLVWATWRRIVARGLETQKHDLAIPAGDVAGLSVDEHKLLSTLLGDARAALAASSRS